MIWMPEVPGDILRWTVEEDKFIQKWSGTVVPEFEKAFHRRFPGRLTTEALRARRATPEEDEMIREWPASEEDSFFDAFSERFLGQRTRRSLMTRWKEVRGLKKQGDFEKWRCRWSAEEDEFIIAGEIAFQDRFLGRRTKTAVCRRWDTLRAKKMVKGDIAQLSGSVWLPEQDEFQKRFPNLRTDSAIKNRWNLWRNNKNA
ncbi:hypothetical protein FHL15_009224 [Xylaria flabelliformis]|uniref:Myb-like domain-containing protein n=1 Tax=Xylaria flabelliformis TaxID=2512241 RepID=A0A553HPT1_9PEZI|nr:hypothetical protein FHL15_009224 [Xylaria flabelliformis]